MRRILKALGLIALSALLLSSCSKSLNASTNYSPAQIAQAIISEQASLSALQPLFPDDDYYSEYLSDIYRLDASAIKDGIICYSNGMLAFEIAIFQLVDKSSASEVKETLEKYKERRTDAFMGYAPMQASIVENSIVVTHGDYAALLICEDAPKAQSVFMACFSDAPPFIGDDIWPIILDDDDKSPENEPDPTTEISKPPSSEDEAANDQEANGTAVNDQTNNDEPVNGETVNDETLAGEAVNDNAISNESPPEEPANAEQGNNETAGAESGSAPAPNDSNANGAAEDNTEAEIEPTEQEDVYDSNAILRAWRSGDATGLSCKNKKILDACAEIIAYVTNEGMSEYEKELAIHDWIIDWVSYDEETLSNSPNAKPDLDNDNPYGALFSRKAICSGYTSTFQLFMDMLGIECISVNGVYVNTGEKHAWNMVRIDGEWYCVDVTWNDPASGSLTNSVRHRYFNVTSQFMLETGHQWDESLTPVADAGKLYKE